MRLYASRTVRCKGSVEGQCRHGVAGEPAEGEALLMSTMAGPTLLAPPPDWPSVDQCLGCWEDSGAEQEECGHGR